MGELIKNNHLSKTLIELLKIPAWYSKNKYLTHHIPDIIISEPSLGNIPEDYTEWENICPKIKLFIECKSGKLNIENISRIFWYSLAYKVPVVVFSQERINQSLKSKIGLFKKHVNMKVQMFEKFKIGERKKWLNTLNSLLFG
ncbi:hypothetical protein [Thermococcus sp.]